MFRRSFLKAAAVAAVPVTVNAATFPTEEDARARLRAAIEEFKAAATAFDPEIASWVVSEWETADKRDAVCRIVIAGYIA